MERVVQQDSGGQAGGRILVVEDEVELASVVARHLEGEGYKVAVAGSIMEARAILQRHSQNLVVLDVLLPDGSGFDLAPEIRRMTSAPIIFATALGEDASVVRGLEAGGDDYITKPFNLDVLSARIKSLLRRSGVGAPAPIELPPLRIDLLAGQASIGGRQLRLTGTELKLLALFATNPGRGFTQAELLELVWNDTSGLPTNTVRVHISKLRRKLSMDANPPFELVLTDDRRYAFQRLTFLP
ncbi:MAG: response regulator transcription factor [Bifidobacteriaceae bacterium]|jgi:DNA-binding response OmpR family regulator|nr:response regulator transcription factor [Bifidobacteriaceae bacterium]